MSLLCSFNTSHSAFLTVTSLADNRLNVYDTINGSQISQLVPDGHLNKLNTCSALAVGGQLKRKKKSKSSASSSEELGFAALGTEKGTVLVWNLQSGELVHRLGEKQQQGGSGHTARVLSVAFHPTQPLLYSTAEDKAVIEWSLETGEIQHRWSDFEHAQHRLCVSPDGQQLCSASAELALLDLASKRRVKAYTGGHATPVSSLVYSADGKFIISGAADRFLTVWSSDVEGSTLPLQSLSMDHEPIEISISGFVSEDSSRIPILAVSKSNQVLVWHFTPPAPSFSGNKKKDKSKPDSSSSPSSLPSLAPIFRVGLAKRQKPAQGGKAPEDNSSLLSARFVSASNLLIASGTNVLPYFDQVAYFQPEDSQVVQNITEIPRRAASHLLSLDANAAAVAESKKRKSAAAAGVTVLGPESASLPTVSLAASTASAASPAAPSASAAALEDESKRAKRSKKSGKDDADEPTIEERVAAIQAAGFEKRSSKLASASSPSASSSVVPTADSLQSVLVQALHTDDSSLLEYCLSSRNAKLIERTIDRLPTPYVLPFLNKVIDKFQSTPGRGLALIIWIKEILTRHTSYLLSVPSLHRSLSSLYAVMDSRVSGFQRVLSLSGRLELLLSQVKLQKASASGNSSATVSTDGPVAVYDEDEVDGGDSDEDSDDHDDDEAAELDDELEADADLLSDEDDE